MNTVKFTVPFGEIARVLHDLKASKIKYYPIRKMFNGYRIEVADHPAASFLMLKYGFLEKIAN